MKQARLVSIGACCLVVGLTLLGMTFLPVLRNEISYALTKNNEVVIVDRNTQTLSSVGDVIVVKDQDFGIVIPKIRANASIVPNVDPDNSDIYQDALTIGVAHALGTPLPSQGGNTFLFSHSSSNFFEATRYNSIFYLLSKLEIGDEIYLYENNVRYKYRVRKSDIVNHDRVEYMNDLSGADLTLMTCWPAGTDLKRLVVTAQKVDETEVQVD